jgi:hypothetical protein
MTEVLCLIERVARPRWANLYAIKRRQKDGRPPEIRRTGAVMLFRFLCGARPPGGRGKGLFSSGSLGLGLHNNLLTRLREFRGTRIQSNPGFYFTGFFTLFHAITTLNAPKSAKMGLIKLNDFNRVGFFPP